MKKIKAMVQQGVDVVLFQNGQYRNTVSSMETSEGCPIQPGSSVQKVIYLVPSLRSNLDRSGIALDGTVRSQAPNLASSTLYVHSLTDSITRCNWLHANNVAFHFLRVANAQTGWPHRTSGTRSASSCRMRSK